MKVKSESEVVQSYPTLSDPMDYGPPGSSIHGIFQARVLEWGAIAFSDLSITGLNPSVVSSAWTGRFFTFESPGKSSHDLQMQKYYLYKYC